MSKRAPSRSPFLISALAKVGFIVYNGRALAGVMELVDVTDSKSVGGDIVRVRVPPPAPEKSSLRKQ